MTSISQMLKIVKKKNTKCPLGGTSSVAEENKRKHIDQLEKEANSEKTE